MSVARSIRRRAADLIVSIMARPFSLNLLSRLLSRNGQQLMHKVFEQYEHAAFKRYIRSRGEAAMYSVLHEEDFAALRTLLLDDEMAVLRALMPPGSDALSRLLVMDDFSRLRKAVYANENEILREILKTDPQRALEILHSEKTRQFIDFLCRDDRAVLKELFGLGSKALASLLLDDDGRRIKAMLATDDYAVLKSLYGVDSKALASLLLDDDGKRIKAFLAADDYAALKSLYGVGSKALIALFLDDNGKRMKATLAADDYAPLKSLYGADSKALASLLLDEDGKRIRSFLFRDDFAQLASLIQSEGAGALRHILLMNDSSILKSVLREKNGEYLHKLLFDHSLIDDISSINRVRAHVQFEEEWQKMIPAISSESEMILQQLKEQKSLLTTSDKVWEHLTRAVEIDGVAQLRGGNMRFPDRHALWGLIQEILVNEDYYFETSAQRPVILDCGAHYGMGLYYFLTLYPEARVLAFEPDPGNFEILTENTSANHFEKAELHPFALSDRDKTETFFVSETYSMASSLMDRRKAFGDDIREIEVECRRLSPYLLEPIDFLKLDIEGAEDLVLEECGEALRNVHYLFCEYHQGAGLPGDRLTKILHILDKNGFVVHVGKSHGYQQSSKHRPMTFVEEPYSAILYAKNKHWNPEGSP